MGNGIARRAALILRHPGMLPAWWRKRRGGMPPLDSVYIECAATCNLDCRFCFSRHTPETLGLMRGSTFSAVARRLFPYAYAVNFVGYGEPLLNRRLPWMIRTVKSYGREAHVTTNGILMDEGRICELIAAGADSVAVSLDGATPVSHDANRGEGSFEATTWNMGILRKVKEKLRIAKPVLSVDTIITRSNNGEIPGLLALAKGLGAACVNLAHLQVCGEAEAAESLLGVPLDAEYRAWQEKARSLGLRLRLPEEFANCAGRGCFWDPERRLAVTWDGEVRPCCFLLHSNRWRCGGREFLAAPPPLGNLTRQSFAAIWRNEGYRRFREAVARGDRWPEPCGPCALRSR